MKKMFVTTKDNEKIAFNLFQTGHDSVLIIVHGWFMTKDSKPFLEMSEVFSKCVDVITMDCRGHGKSSGKYTFTEKEELDLKAVVDFAKENYKKIFLLGFSLGGALVLLHGAKDNEIEKIIAVSPPSRFEKIENRVWHHRAFIPTILKFELKTWLSVRADYLSLLNRNRTAPIDIIERVQAPVLFAAGDNDPIVCKWHTQNLYEKAGCKKSFELFQNCNHAEDLFIKDKERFVQAIQSWIEL